MRIFALVGIGVLGAGLWLGHAAFGQTGAAAKPVGKADVVLFHGVILTGEGLALAGPEHHRQRILRFGVARLSGQFEQPARLVEVALDALAGFVHPREPGAGVGVAAVGEALVNRRRLGGVAAAAQKFGLFEFARRPVGMGQRRQPRGGVAVAFLCGEA